MEITVTKEKDEHKDLRGGVNWPTSVGKDNNTST